MATISTEYQLRQKQLHQDHQYGRASLKFAPLITDIMRKTGLRTISDYGAGKCRLKDQIAKEISEFSYFPYDPAFPEYGEPQPAQIVTCIDVLEHIEPHFLDNVIAELKRITTDIAFLSIHTQPATKILADGRNAHLIQQPTSWWLERLIPHFEIIQLTPVKNGFWVIVQVPDKKYASYFEQKKPKSSAIMRAMRKLRFFSSLLCR